MIYDIPKLYPTLVLMAAASDAVYYVDKAAQTKVLTALGLEVVQIIDTPARWATVCRRTTPTGERRNLVAFQGTEFTENTNPAEIWCDVDLLPWTPPGKSYDLPEGFGKPLWEIADAILAACDPNLETDATGHSLGGQSAQIAPGIFPRPITCFPINAPTGASSEFWEATKMSPKIPLYNEAEFARNWGTAIWWGQVAQSYLWLHQSALLEVTKRPGFFNFSIRDHFISPTRLNLSAAGAHL